MACSIKNNNILFLLCLALTPTINIFSQNSSIKSDTVYYDAGKHNIQKVTTVNGTRKKVQTFYKNGNKYLLENYVNNKYDGVYRRWEQNGNLAEEIEYKEGLFLKRKQWYNSGFPAKIENYKLAKKDSLWKSEFDGKYLEYYNNNCLKTEGRYKLNKKDGKWVEYYENGKKKSEVHYKENLKYGKALYWTKSGQITAKYNYSIETIKGKSKEVFDGKQLKYFENGKLSEKSNYKKGKKEGLFEQWFENGNKKEETVCKNDFINGKNKAWFPNGNLMQDMNYTYVYDSLKKSNIIRYEGKYITYYENGNFKKTGNYVNGKEDGLFTDYRPTGQKSCEINYTDGLMNGKFIRWNESGIILEETNYILIKKNDTIKSVLDGESIKYYDDKKIYVKANYKLDKLDGLFERWYQDGIKAEEILLCNGLKCGKSITWNKNGTISHEQFFRIDSASGVNQSIPDGVEKIYNNKGFLSQKKYFNKQYYFYKTEDFFEDGTVKDITYNFVKADYYIPRLGKFSKFFSNGQLKSESFYLNERPVGRVLEYYINGNLKSLVDYEVYHCTNVGYNVQWSSDGELVSFRKYSTYKDYVEITDTSLANIFYETYTHLPKRTCSIAGGEKEEGKWITWYKNGHKHFEENFENSRLNGIFMTYFPDGNKLCEIEMKDGFANGKFTIFNVDGKKFREGFYTDGIPTGLWIDYFENGNKEKEYELSPNEKPYSYQKEWYQNGNPKNEMHYRNGKQHGYFASWYENGQLNYESNWVEGKAEGENKSYYQNGKLRLSHIYNNNLTEGVETEWYENGNTKQVLTYHKGKRNGLYQQWWEKGVLKLEGYFKNDEQDSIWTLYSEDGSINTKTTYINGILQRVQSDSKCECVDSTKNKIGYVPLLNNLASLETVRKMSFNFHAPIGDFYNHLFYIGLLSDAGRDASFYTFKIISFQKIFLQLPDENGIKLILNPCVNTGSVESRLEFSIHSENGNKEGTSASLYPKYLAIEFNPELLHQWDKKQSAPLLFSSENSKKNEQKSGFVPAELLFKSERIDYNAQDRLKVSGLKDPCFTESEIGKSGILLNFKEMTPDFDLLKNPETIDYSSLNWQDEINIEPKAAEWYKKANENFVGVYVPNAQITLPKDLFQIQTVNPVTAFGKNFMLSGKFILGTIRIKAVLSEGLNYEIPGNEKITFNTKSVEKEFQKRGFRKVITAYDTKTSEFIIYIYLEI